MSETRILIVEDEAIVAEDLVGKVRRLGYEIAGVADEGEEAIAMAGRLWPDLIFMDIRLDGKMDGIEAAEVIGRKFDIPVIFLTAHSDSDTLARARLTGPFGYILKPFKERELSIQIEMALHKHAAERQVREQREWLQVTLDSIGDGVIATDAEGRITFINPVAQALTGWKTGKAAGQPITRVLQLVSEEDGQSIECPVTCVLRERCTLSMDRRTAMVARGGRFIPIEDTASPILDAGGKLIGAVLVFQDVTEKRKAEEVIRKNEERFREAFEHAPVGMKIMNLDGSFVHVNEAYCRMVGYPREELFSKIFYFQKLIHPDDLDENMEAFHRLLAGEIPAYFIEKRYIRKDGDTIWVRASAGLRKNNEGNPIQIVGLVEDITPRKKAEEELRQAQKMEAIGRLAGGVAHEFNNMLNVIIGYADIMDSRMEENDPLNQYLREIQAAARRSAEMTNQLLAYSRKQMVQPKVVDLNKVIENQKMMLSRLIRENIRIRFDPGSDLWPIRIDPSQIDQILANLTVNARDAITSTGEVIIATQNVRIKSADALPDLPPGDYVRLTFADTGIGMGKKVLERVFDPYFTTKEVGKGTGLGLATVYGIVKQNNGAIFADSEPGHGTTFTIYLPRSQAEAEVEPAAEEALIANGTETVLIVEDELQVLNIAEIMLKEVGYRVLTANSPGEAIRIAQRNQRIDLLLTDVIMPEMNGRALQSLIEELQPSIRTLLMSGYAEDDIDRQALRGRSADLIRKPFTVGSLTEKVRDVLDRK